MIKHNLIFSEEEYKNIQQLKHRQGRDYLTDSAFVEELLKNQVLEIREELNEMEVRGEVLLDEEIKIKYYLHSLLCD